MKLTTPAYVTFIASVILVISMLLPANIGLYDANTDKIVVEKYDVKRRVVMILLLTIPLAIHVYSINCLQVGNCVVWSWIVTGIVVMWILSFLLLAFGS